MSSRMRADAVVYRPPVYRVMDQREDIILRDDQVVVLHRVMMRTRLQTYLRALRGQTWWHIIDLRDLFPGRLGDELGVQLSDLPQADQRGVVLYAMRAVFPTLDACMSAIGRVAIVAPLDAAQPAPARPKAEQPRNDGSAPPCGATHEIVRCTPCTGCLEEDDRC